MPLIAMLSLALAGCDVAWGGATLSLELVDQKGGIYYRCTAELVAERGTPEPQGADEAELELGSWGDAEVYDGQLLFHGPAFQMIQKIAGISDRGMVAELSGVEQSSWAEGQTDAGGATWSTSGWQEAVSFRQLDKH